MEREKEIERTLGPICWLVGLWLEGFLLLCLIAGLRVFLQQLRASVTTSLVGRSVRDSILAVAQSRNVL